MLLWKKEEQIIEIIKKGRGIQMETIEKWWFIP